MNENKINILKDRAQKAAKIEQTHIKQDGIDMLHFRLGDEYYAIDSALVSEVYPKVSLTQVPYTPSFIKGIFHIRGRFVSIVDTKEFLGIKKEESKSKELIILLSYDNMEFGIEIDEVIGQLIITLKDLKNIPVDLELPKSDLIQGINTQGVIVLNAKKFIQCEEMSIDIN